MSKYHVYGIGNALVDMEMKVAPEFLTAQNIDKGLMTLIEQDRQEEILKAFDGDFLRASGGSAANTVIAVSQFGGKSYYSCKVANDEAGEFYFNDLKANGVETNASEGREEGTTGKCLVMVTPDADRTMNTFLGITSNYSPAELREEEIKQAEYLYIEGYLVASPTGLQAMMEAKKIAENNNVKTALTLSDPNMVNFFKNQMYDVIGHGVDLLFCNDDEAKTFTEEETVDAAVEKLKKLAKVFVVTLGKEGALIWDGEKKIQVNAQVVDAIDTNGAGDMFAGAFLYAITHGKDLETAGKFGCLAASHVVSKYGPRLDNEEAKDVFYKAFQS